MRHPAERFIKYAILKSPTADDAAILKITRSWGMLDPLDKEYLPDLRAGMQTLPTGFDPANKLHRESMSFLRKHGVYHLFHQDAGTSEAWDILSDPQRRLSVEQLLMARIPLPLGVMKLNQKSNWKLTVDGVQSFGAHFWDVSLLTFDDWGAFLSGRSAMHERHMSLLDSDPTLAFHHLRFNQQLDSQKVIERAQEIVYFTLEEVAAKPGAGVDKVKSVASLVKATVDLHAARSTSDMALKDVLKQFEKFRMDHPHAIPPSIHELASRGNFSGSGLPIALPPVVKNDKTKN